MFNGVEYTPLDYGDGYVEYILQDNGTYEIRNERDIVMEFDISDVIIPNGFPTRIEAALFASSSDVEHRLILQNVNCLNYPYMVHDNYASILFRFGNNASPITDNDQTHWTCDNGVFTTFTYESNQIRCRITPTNANLPIVIRYLEFIVAVANYSSDTP